MKETADCLEQEHKNQISEAIKNLEASDQTHQQEITRMRDEALQQTKREVSLLEKSIQEKNSELRQLQKQLADMEREKHTEIVKLRLEYDAKLLKLQKTNVTKSQSGQTSNINSDIFRKKLQAMKAESERDVTSLKSKVAQLERKLAQEQEQQTQQRGQQFSLKRKRF